MTPPHPYKYPAIKVMEHIVFPFLFIIIVPFLILAMLVEAVIEGPDPKL